MQHSIKHIGNDYEKLSLLRKDKIQFNAEEFYQFANDNKKKYSIIENGDDLLVSSWFSNDLIEDYKKSKNM